MSVKNAAVFLCLCSKSQTKTRWTIGSEFGVPPGVNHMIACMYVYIDIQMTHIKKGVRGALIVNAYLMYVLTDTAGVLEK